MCRGRVSSGSNGMGSFSCEGKWERLRWWVGYPYFPKDDIRRVKITKNTSFLLNILCQLFHVPFESRINKKRRFFRFVWVKHAPKLAEFILSHCEWWEPRGWLIKESIRAIRLEIVLFAHCRFCLRLDVTDVTYCKIRLAQSLRFCVLLHRTKTRPYNNRTDFKLQELTIRNLNDHEALEKLKFLQVTN